MTRVKFYVTAVLTICLFTILTAASQANAAHMNQLPTGGDEDFFVYLPIIIKAEPVQNTIVKLVSPANNAVLDTLIPVFVYETEAVPDNTGSCLTFSTNPNPTNCMSSSGLYPYSQRERVMWFNLQPSTTYYWRVGAILNFDYNTIEWSEERTFVTGPSGGVILPAPTLVAPANNSLVNPATVTLQWNAVTGAVEYDVTVHDLDADRWYGLGSITEPQAGPEMLEWIFNYASGTHFEWYVAARNDYAWGDNSASWNFSIPAAQNRESNLSLPALTTHLNGQGRVVYTQPGLSGPAD